MRSVPVYNVYNRVVAHCSHPEAWSMISDDKARVLTMVPFQIQLNTPPERSQDLSPAPSAHGARVRHIASECMEVN